MNQGKAEIFKSTIDYLYKSLVFVFIKINCNIQNITWKLQLIKFKWE